MEHDTEGNRTSSSAGTSTRASTLGAEAEGLTGLLALLATEADPKRLWPTWKEGCGYFRLCFHFVSFCRRLKGRLPTSSPTHIHTLPVASCLVGDTMKTATRRETEAEAEASPSTSSSSAKSVFLPHSHLASASMCRLAPARNPFEVVAAAAAAAARGETSWPVPIGREPVPAGRETRC